ncbi:effector, partial ['Crotalaria aegyptiaca' phytoplasma]|nr:effector ['Crotalaria aegyptiaca' phytoplasma]
MFIIIKKIIQWVSIILGLLSCFLIGFLVLTKMNIIKLPKTKIEIPSIKETKFENVEEWYDDNKKCQMIKAKYTFDGLNGIGYYRQQLANKANIGAFEFMKIQDRLEIQKEPTNLANYIQEGYPFDRWNDLG